MYNKAVVSSFGPKVIFEVFIQTSPDYIDYPIYLSSLVCVCTDEELQ